MQFLSIQTMFKNDTKYYTFKKIEHEVLLLKKLDDNKIFYNNTIYDRNFFYYHKLEGFMEQIYELRDEYIIENLDMIFLRSQPRLSIKQRIKTRIKNTFKFIKGPLRSIKSILYSKRNKNLDLTEPLINFIDYDPTNCDEITGLVKDQYDILVTAYKYEFEYLLDFDLLNPKIKLEKNSFKEIKLMKDFFYDWFYVLGWRCIKPVQLTFAEPFEWKHYEDEKSKNMNLSYLNRTVITDHREDVIFRNRYDHPFDVGTRFKLEWIEDKYDEKKKFEEFDINCKTNSYYTRYIAYNEIYNKDYPEEKKFKTDLIHDFTEEEIQENYENMINTEQLALTRFNFVMFNEKRRTAVLDFFKELETLEVSREKLVYDFYWNHEVDSHMELNREVDTILYEVLNNPRYLLIMPLVDAYFDVFRSKSYYDPRDDSFGTPPWHDNGCHRKLMKYLKYFELSYERQYFYAEKTWLIDDYMEIEDVEWDEEYEEEWDGFMLALGTFIWLVGLTWYVIICWFIALDAPLLNNYLGNLVDPDYSALFKTFVYDQGDEKLRQMFCPEIYYGLELRRPRARTKSKRILLPYKFYEPSYYSYSKYRAHRMLPNTILDELCYNLDEEDYGLYDLNRKLDAYGKSHMFWQIRLPLIEPDYPWDNVILLSPLEKLRRLVLRIAAFIEKKFDASRRSSEFWDAYWIFYDTYLKEHWEPVMAYYKRVNIAYIGLQKSIKAYLIQAKDFIIEFFKKPTN